ILLHQQIASQVNRWYIIFITKLDYQPSNSTNQKLPSKRAIRRPLNINLRPTEKLPFKNDTDTKK
ncbi:hypothetical protein Bpfe_015401, partial [Biomphalaria pfeifferi]